MTGSTRKLGLVLVLSTFFAPAVWAQDVNELFNQGVDALKQGKDEEALSAFQKVLAMQPSHEQAYALWKSTDHQVWLDMLTKRGEFELVGKHLMSLAEMGRAERKNDGEAIKTLLGTLRNSADLVERRSTLRTLAAEHGEYAVPYMLPTLADQGEDDARVLYMHSLTEMDTDVVLPLIEALKSSDAFLRRNVAYTLGYIGDPRAAGALAALGAKDDNETTRTAALEALAKCGKGDAVKNWLDLGAAYHYRADNVIGSKPTSAVVWNWNDDKLVAKPTMGAVYADELAKKCYAAALVVDPTNAQARMGLARAHASSAARLQALADGGTELGDARADLDNSTVAARLAGVDALDMALSEAVKNNDPVTAIALCQALGANARGPGLDHALRSGDAVVRAHAAIAAGEAAVLARSKATAEVVANLGAVAGREIVRVVALIDGNAARSNAIAQALEAQGVSVHQWDRGAAALAMLHRARGLDALLVADSLSDLTTAQVVDDLLREPQFGKTALFIVSADAEKAAQVWGERAKGTLVGAEGVGVVIEALASIEGDRAVAVQLATHAARVLADLAAGGTDLAPVFAALRTAAMKQADPVALGAIRALSISGDGDCANDLAAVAAEGSRSEAVRAAAAHAAGACFSRGVQASESALTGLAGVVGSDAPIAVRAAAAQAVGAASITTEMRAKLLHGGASM